MNFDNLSEKIVARRFELGITQKELAAKTKIKAGYISKIENRKIKRCRPGTLKRIADALNVNAGWFIDIEEKKTISDN
jgi:transcriptional regulator with XRE-family HTH domain